MHSLYKDEKSCGGDEDEDVEAVLLLLLEGE